MVFYNDTNIAAFNQKKNTYPSKIYIPLNLNRTTRKQNEQKGSFTDERPAESVELTDWVNISMRRKKIIPSHLPVRTTATATTLDPTTDSVLIVTETATITLPDPTNWNGWTFSIRVAGTKTATLDPVGSVQIDGGNTAAVANGASVAVGRWITDGTAYYKIA